MAVKKGNPASIDDYIAQFPEDVQRILREIRAVIKESAPQAVEKVSYGMPAFHFHGDLVWFAVWKHHIGLYPIGPDDEAFKKELAGFKGTKGSVHFPLDKPMPYDLIRKIVQYRLAENLKK